MKYCAVCADAGRARIFVLDARDVGTSPPQQTLSQLEEREGMVNPARRLQDAQIFSDSRPGLRQVGGGAASQQGARHGVDDRRGQHRLDEDRRFARSICQHTAELCRELGECELIIAAAPRMLGMLRAGVASWDKGTRSRVRVHSLRKDVARLSAPELHDYFADANVVPARGRLMHVMH